MKLRLKLKVSNRMKHVLQRVASSELHDLRMMHLYFVGIFLVFFIFRKWSHNFDECLEWQRSSKHERTQNASEHAQKISAPKYFTKV